MHRIHRTSCREKPPTDDTDAHRCRRVWHPCHTHAAKFCEFCEFRGRTAHSKHLCKSVKSVGEKRFPQNARNSQKLLAEKSLPQMARMFTDVGGYGIPAIHTLTNSVNSVNSVGEKIFPQNARNSQKLLAEKRLPQMSTDAHRCRRVWHPCHTLLRRNPWEDISAGGSVNSAYSVGEYPIEGGVGMARCHTLLRMNLREDT